MRYRRCARLGLAALVAAVASLPAGLASSAQPSAAVTSGTNECSTWHVWDPAGPKSDTKYSNPRGFERHIYWALDYKKCWLSPGKYLWTFRLTYLMAVTRDPGAVGYNKAWIYAQYLPSGAIGEERPLPTGTIYGAPVKQTYGFEAGVDIKLGVPPVEAGGHATASYTTEMTKPTMSWHPIFRKPGDNPGSGGIRWCNDTAQYDTITMNGRLTVKMNGTKTSPSAAPFWDFWTGQSKYGC
jgi:hypothetical protein